MALTDKEYVDKGGTRCPYCESEDIEAQRIEVDAGHAYQYIVCLNCNACWYDVYDLVGIDREEE